jgi:hypothetical protein
MLACSQMACALRQEERAAHLSTSASWQASQCCGMCGTKLVQDTGTAHMKSEPARRINDVYIPPSLVYHCWSCYSTAVPLPCVVDFWLETFLLKKNVKTSKSS